jgi:hypothetical protein
MKSEQVYAHLERILTEVEGVLELCKIGAGEEELEDIAREVKEDFLLAVRVESILSSIISVYEALVQMKYRRHMESYWEMDSNYKRDRERNKEALKRLLRECTDERSKEHGK